MATWKQWTTGLGWRQIAEESTSTMYIGIEKSVNGVDYEVGRVSRYCQRVDGDKPHVETSIREFNSRTVLHSTATRDLGITRFLTYKGRPIFVFEPGGDVLEWRAAEEGVSDRQLVKIMRAGDLGRRVRRRDRLAAKNSREELAAVRQELRSELAEVGAREQDLLARIAEMTVVQEEMEVAKKEAEQDRDRMRDNLIKGNQERKAEAPLSSGSMACPLGTAERDGYKLTSTKPLPGNFEG